MPRGIYIRTKPFGKPFQKGHPNYLIKHTNATKRKISLKNKGKPASGGSFKKGHKPFNGSGCPKGFKHTEETKLKMSLGIKKHYDKIGRKKYKRYKHFTSTKEYQKWRSDVFQRDNWTCQTCGKKSEIGKCVYLEAHHIKKWAYFPELRYEVNNGITLCKECHRLTRKN